MGRRPDPADFLPLTRDAFFILLSVAAEPRHGYAIIRDVESRSDGSVRLQTGALYRTLRLLLTDGLLEECARPAGVETDDERRRYYQPTALGRAVLTAEVDRMARVVRAARRTVKGRRPRLV